MKTNSSRSIRRTTARRAGRVVAAGAAFSLAMMGTVAPGFAAPSEQPERPLIDTSKFVDDGTYIVTLAEEAASSYEGGVSGIPATAPGKGQQMRAKSAAVKKYQAHLKKKHQEVAASVDATPSDSYTLTLNGFAAELTALQASKLAASKNVIGVEKEQVYKIQQSTTDFLGLGDDANGEGGVWGELGGVENAGEGVVVGIIDTGVAPENPSFAGQDLSAEIPGEPYLDGETITFKKADGGTFTGTCQSGVQFAADDCNTKLIGAQYFVDGFGADRVATVANGEYLSPRDGNGHGSHTASTAAGNFGVEANLGALDMGTISGVAPAAKIASYKACWTGNTAIEVPDGCFTTDLLNAIEAATDDGVDVINYSIGGGAATTTVSATGYAFFGAANAGIFVSASAGNSGPGASTLDNASPWITTVGNSTFDTPQSSAILGDEDRTPLTGASLSISDTVGPAPLTLAEDVAAADAVNPGLCGLGTLDPVKTEGKVVVCDRGGHVLVDKATAVAEAGGVGMILVNTPGGSSDLHAIQYQIPAVHLLAEDRETVRSYAATENPTVSLQREAVDPIGIPAPQIALSSSRGPVLADGSNVLKPDVTAPGTGVLAAGANAEGEDPQQISLSGTSMAAPHVAGLAALYLGNDPEASVAEVKSALMTTAYNLVDAGNNEISDVFTQGAGHVNPSEYLNPGMYFPAGTDEWVGYMQGLGFAPEGYDAEIPDIEGSDLNQASIAIGQLTEPRTISRTVISTEAGTYTASVDMPGFNVEVSEDLVFSEAGQERSFTVTIERTDAPTDEFSDGYLTWTSTEGKTVRIPMAVAPVSVIAPSSVEGTGVEGSIDMTATPGITGAIEVNALGLAKGEVFSGSAGATEFLTYETTIAEDAKLATFDLDSVDDAADLDLVVARLEAGAVVDVWQSATASADERIDLTDPEPGTYLMQAVVYSTANGAAEAAFDLTNFVVPSAPTDTPLTVSPATLDAGQNVEQQLELSWAGLEYASEYMGVLYYGDSTVTTFVNVSTGAAPCREPGPPAHAGERGKPDHAGEQGKPDYAKLAPCKPVKPGNP